MSRRHLGAALALGLLAAALLAPRGARALSVTFDYSLDTGGFFANPAAVTALESAADVFEAFTDSLAAITPGGVNTWDAQFTHPSTGAAHSITDLSVAADEVIVFAGARDLPGSVLGQGGPGGFSATGTLAFVEAVAGRGQPGALTNPETDFGPWGGSVAFDDLTSWHFGLDTAGLDPGEADFLSVALHELAHLFGFGTSDVWDEWVSGGVFTGPAAVAAFGGNVPLNPGADHWAEGTTDGGQEAAMDPSLALGERKLLTPLDSAALEDLGWQAAALPEAERGLLVAAALMLLAGLRATRRPAPSRRAADRPPRPRPARPVRPRAPLRSRGSARATG